MSAEFVGIELQLMGADGVRADLQQLDKLLNSLRGRKKFDAGFNEARSQVVAYRGELEKLRREQSKFEKGSDEWNAYAAEIEGVRNKLRDASQAVREFSLAGRQAGQTFRQTFNSISSRVAHIGSSMQSLGNALTRLTSPFARIATGALYGAGYKALNTLTEGLSGSFTRADTMNKYVKLMAEYEKANYSAAQSRQDLDDSIQGLPIALDEAIGLAQRYTLSLGDMERGTKLAIATNNAFLASMATESQRYQGMLQLQDLMNGKKLTSREWMSLGSSMGKAINEVGLQLGYSKDELGEFRQELYSGKIASKDFLDALIAVGTGSGKLVGLAKVSAQTWEGLFSNVRIAVTRMGANVIETLNETFKQATGRTLLQNLLGLDADGNEIGGGIKHWINDISTSIQDWIKANPDKIIDFFNDLKKIDVKGLFQGIAEGLGGVANFVKSITDMLGEVDTRRLGKMMIWGNLLGKALTITGGVVKGLRGPVALIGTLAKWGTKGGLLGRIADFIGVGKNASDIGDTVAKAESALPAMGKLGTGLHKFFIGWAEVAAIVGGSSLVAWGSTKAFKEAFKNIREIANEVAMIDWGTATPALIGMADWIAALAGIGNLIGNNPVLMKDLGLGALFAGLLTVFAGGVFWATMEEIKQGFQALSDATSYINTALDNLKNIREIDGGVIDKIKNAKKVLNQITELLAIDRNNPVTGQASGGLKELDKKSAQTVENLATALSSMKSSIESLNEINNMEISTDKIEEITSGASTALGFVGQMFERLPEVFKKAKSVSTGENLNEVLTNIKDSFNMLIGEGGLLSMIPQINEQMQALVSEGQLTKLSVQMGTLGSSLKGIWAKLNIGMSSGSFNLEQLTNLANAMIQVRRVIYHINKLGATEVNTAGITNISTALEGIKDAFSSVSVASIVEQVNSFVTSIQDAFTAFEQLNQEIVIDASVKLSDGFNNSVNAVVKQINTARTRINNAWSKVPTTLSKTISVSIGAKVNYSGAVSAITSGISAAKSAADAVVNPHTGGYIGNRGLQYRARGGSIFKPRGTDTVPAMLTPGEYVHNRRAVNLFGIDFMRKVNQLDMRGAMNELLTRAGHMANVGRQTVVNNTYNNNQKVVQNINTNSPDFAFKSASRFAGAF